MWKELFLCTRMLPTKARLSSSLKTQNRTEINQGIWFLSNLNNAFSAPNIWTVDEGCLAKFRSDPVIEHIQVEATRHLISQIKLMNVFILNIFVCHWPDTAQRIYMQSLISLPLINFTRNGSPCMLISLELLETVKPMKWDNLNARQLSKKIPLHFHNKWKVKSCHWILLTGQLELNFCPS